MDYVQLTDDQRKTMLDAIGVQCVDDLYASLDPALRLKAPLQLADLPTGQSELEITRRLSELAAGNRTDSACFLGGGAYDHFIPASVDHLAGQSAFVTAYTPYQAEASQGSLQAFFEFQTQIARLTSLEVANASLYDGATAVTESALMAVSITGRRRVLVASTIHPHYRAVLRCYLVDLAAELVELPADPVSGRITTDALAQAMRGAEKDAACVIVQSPSALGIIEDWSSLFAAARDLGDDKGPLCVAVFNPIACGLLKRPGDCGADIAVAEGQCLGIPLQFGGPYLGIIATRDKYVRKMPGRLVGQTTDKLGRRGFCLTLQTREQHIRGAKATSNICTNQGLMALRAAVYLSAMGPHGLRNVAEQCYHKAHHAARQIARIPGYTLAHSDSSFFHEFVVNCPAKAVAIIATGRSRGIQPGLDAAKFGVGRDDQLLVAVTEKRTRQQIDALVSLLSDVAEGN